MSLTLSPVLLSATKAADPVWLTGRLLTTAQSGVLNVVALTTSRTPTVQAPRPFSQSCCKSVATGPSFWHSGGALGLSMVVKLHWVGARRNSTAAIALLT